MHWREPVLYLATCSLSSQLVRWPLTVVHCTCKRGCVCENVCMYTVRNKLTTNTHYIYTKWYYNVPCQLWEQFRSSFCTLWHLCTLLISDDPMPNILAIGAGYILQGYSLNLWLKLTCGDHYTKQNQGNIRSDYLSDLYHLINCVSEKVSCSISANTKLKSSNMKGVFHDSRRWLVPRRIQTWFRSKYLTDIVLCHLTAGSSRVRYHVTWTFYHALVKALLSLIYTYILYFREGPRILIAAVE